MVDRLGWELLLRGLLRARSPRSPATTFCTVATAANNATGGPRYRLIGFRRIGLTIAARSRRPRATSRCSASSAPYPLSPNSRFLPIARWKQAGPERRCLVRSALAAVRGYLVDATLCRATLCRATLCRATLCQRRRGCQFNHGVYA